LANYLKALAILRLVVEQRADRDARGWWDGERFCLSSNLTRNELERFFLDRYQPTPLLSPWNKGCGFFKPDDPGLAPIERSTAPRFLQFRSAVADARQLLDALTDADTVIRAIKARTKTNKSFQSEAQREILERSSIRQTLLDQLRHQLANPGLDSTIRAELESQVATIESLVAPAKTPLTKADADRLKESPGYKRLLAGADLHFKALKQTLIPDCQRTWRGPHAQWLSAAVVLDEKGGATWPALLGTGGNDGNLDFTNNFMQRLGDLFDLASDGAPLPGAADLLSNALWADPVNRLKPMAIGQFQPGAAGGANSTTGTTGEGVVNPWDFVFMMEGSLLFSSRATRRFDPEAMGRASAPFVVRSHAAGFASPGRENAARGEQWMPLWSRPAALSEIAALFSEGRIQLGRRIANRPIDVARAISRLGVARGIECFTRYGYLERNGQSTLAVPLNRVNVHHDPHTHLIDDLAPWLERLRRRATDGLAPARLVQAERHLADTVFAALTHDYSPDRWQAILLAAVAIESLQAAGTAIEVGPIPGLRPEWVSTIDDGSIEVRLAICLGSAAAEYSPRGYPSDPVRHHWLPLEHQAKRYKLSEKRLAKDSRVVVFGRDPLADCAAIVERRLMEAGTKSRRYLPLVSARGCSARLSDLADFLEDSIDLTKILGLARACMAVRWDHWNQDILPEGVPSSKQPEEAWLALRLASLPWPLNENHSIPADPGIVRRLLAGDSAGAANIALARIRAAGIRPPVQTGTSDVQTARLWAAALAFPINHSTAMRAAILLDPKMKGPDHD